MASKRRHWERRDRGVGSFGVGIVGLAPAATAAAAACRCVDVGRRKGRHLDGREKGQPIKHAVVACDASEIHHAGGAAISVAVAVAAQGGETARRGWVGSSAAASPQTAFAQRSSICRCIRGKERIPGAR